MASKTGNETVAGAPDAGRTTDRDEAAGKGAEGIQRDGQHEEVGQHMNRPDGPHGEPGEPEEAGAGKPSDETGGAAEQAGREDQAGKAPEAGGEGAGAGLPESEPGATEDAVNAAEVSGGGFGGDLAYVKEDGYGIVTSSGAVGEGAGAVISAGLGIVSLTGSWLGTVAGARESLIGQLQTSQGAGVAQQIQQVYGDQWHAIALVGGAFALLALIIGVVVLARPAFGARGQQQAPWVKAVSWAGVVLGVVGLLLAVLKYTDAILALPSVQS